MPGLPLVARKVTGHGEQWPEQPYAGFYARAGRHSGIWWFSSTWRVVHNRR